MKIALMLRALGMSAIPLNGNMSQNKRLGSLNKFKAKSRDAIQLNLMTYQTLHNLIFIAIRIGIQLRLRFSQKQICRKSVIDLRVKLILEVGTCASSNLLPSAIELNANPGTC